MSDQNEGIVANFNKFVDEKEVKFAFRTVKDNETGLETKRATIETKIPVPSVEGIIAILEAGGKQLELLQEAVADVIYQRARELLADDEKLTDVPLEALAWEVIANLPKAERKGRGIPKETWEDFSKDYIAVMPGVTGKTAEQVGNAAKILLNKFQAVKTNKPVIKLLQAQLAVYLNSSPNAESFLECVEFLSNKADSLMAIDEASLLEAL
jgi:hypothetical protein